MWITGVPLLFVCLRVGMIVIITLVDIKWLGGNYKAKTESSEPHREKSPGERY